MKSLKNITKVIYTPQWMGFTTVLVKQITFNFSNNYEWLIKQRLVHFSKKMFITNINFYLLTQIAISIEIQYASTFASKSLNMSNWEPDSLDTD